MISQKQHTSQLFLASNNGEDSIQLQHSPLNGVLITDLQQKNNKTGVPGTLFSHSDPNSNRPFLQAAASSKKILPLKKPQRKTPSPGNVALQQDQHPTNTPAPLIRFCSAISVDKYIQKQRIASDGNQEEKDIVELLATLTIMKTAYEKLVPELKIQPRAPVSGVRKLTATSNYTIDVNRVEGIRYVSHEQSFKHETKNTIDNNDETKHVELKNEQKTEQEIPVYMENTQVQLQEQKDNLSFEHNISRSNRGVDERLHSTMINVQGKQWRMMKNRFRLLVPAPARMRIIKISSVLIAALNKVLVVMLSKIILTKIKATLTKSIKIIMTFKLRSPLVMKINKILITNINKMAAPHLKKLSVLAIKLFPAIVLNKLPLIILSTTLPLITLKKVLTAFIHKLSTIKNLDNKWLTLTNHLNIFSLVTTTPYQLIVSNLIRALTSSINKMIATNLKKVLATNINKAVTAKLNKLTIITLKRIPHNTKLNKRLIMRLNKVLVMSLNRLLVMHLGKLQFLVFSHIVAVSLISLQA